MPENAFTAVPVSTVSHENEQLKFDRTGTVPWDVWAKENRADPNRRHSAVLQWRIVCGHVVSATLSTFEQVPVPTRASALQRAWYAAGRHGNAWRMPTVRLGLAGSLVLRLTLGFRCIRDSIHIVVRVGQASIMDSQRIVGRPTLIAAPFQNLVGPGTFCVCARVQSGC